MVDNEPRRPRRIVSTLAIIGFVLLLAVVVLAAVCVGYAHYEFSKTIRERPGVLLQPVPIPSATPLDPQGSMVFCYGVQFAVPWGRPENDECEFSDSQRAAFFRWSDGHEFRSKWPETAIDHFALTGGEDPADRGWIGGCFGDMTETRYDAMGKILRYVPGRPGLFNMNQLACERARIYWKDMALGPEPTAIYYFQTETGRGFQIGDPARSREVWIHFYDKENDFHHCLAFLAKPEAPALTQSELNFILRSLRYVPEKAKTSP